MRLKKKVMKKRMILRTEAWEGLIDDMAASIDELVVRKRYKL